MPFAYLRCYTLVCAFWQLGGQAYAAMIYIYIIIVCVEDGN
jgi:hypothetical protein